jgi:hypothetical protein
MPWKVGILAPETRNFRSLQNSARKQALTTGQEEAKFSCIKVIVYIGCFHGGTVRRKRLLGLFEAELAGLGCCHRLGE